MTRFLRQIALFGSLFLLLHVAGVGTIHQLGPTLHDVICESKAPTFVRQDTPTVILSGSSTLAVNVASEQIHDSLGMPVLTIAKPAHSPARNFHALEKLVREGDIVIQSFDPWIYLTTYSAIHDERMVALPAAYKWRLHNHPVRRLSPFVQVAKHYAAVLSIPFHALKSNRPIEGHRHACLDKSYAPSHRLLGCFQNPTLDATQIEHVRKLHALCHARGATLLLTYPPKSARYLATSEEADRLVQEALHPFATPTPMEYDLEDMADDFHLNCQGAMTFTNHLISRVRGATSVD